MIFALRLGLRQIDGFREADAQRLVSIRDGIAAELNPHLFAPPPIAPPHPVFRSAQDHPLPRGERVVCENAADSIPSPLAGEGGAGSPSEAAPGEGFEGIDHLHPGPPPSRGREHYLDVPDLWRRSGLKRASIERLAAADAFRSVGLDRREALWEVRGLPKDSSLPLFDHANAAETGIEAQALLPVMPLSEHVVNDYRTLRLSLKAHPMHFLRARFESERILACADLKKMRDGPRASVAGVVLVRQRPGSAEGVVFMTMEDESGVANVVIWPQVLERERKVVMAARLVVVHGRIQRHEDIIHVVAARLEDRSHWLRLLDEEGEALSLPLAHADHVKHAGGEDTRERASERRHPRWHPRRHPRAERIIPKSRDFH